MAIKSNLQVFRGEDVTLPFDVDEDITGWTLSLIISDALADATPTLTVSATITAAATGYCEATLTKAQTGALSLSAYYWELVRTNTSAEAVLGYGTLTVLPRVGT